MSSTYKSKIALRAPALSMGVLAWPDGVELRHRLHELRRRQLPADPQAAPICIGIEDAYGDLVYVVETTRLTEAVKAFETLADFGLVPARGRCRTQDGRTLVRTYRRPEPKPSMVVAIAAAGAQRSGPPHAPAGAGEPAHWPRAA